MKLEQLWRALDDMDRAVILKALSFVNRENKLIKELQEDAQIRLKTLEEFAESEEAKLANRKI